MRTSENLNELAVALAKAQGEIEAAPKDSVNPHFKSKYADLSSLWSACRKPLSKNGLSVSQGFEPSGSASVRISTRLLHTSGQWIESDLDLLPKDPSPQAVGSCITYGRRYALGAIVGLVSDEDDDGNHASGHAPAKTARREPETFEIPFGSTTVAVPAKKAPTAVIYDNSVRSHQDKIVEILEKNKVDDSLHKKIGSRLNGRPFTDLRTVTDEVLKEIEQ